MKRNKLHNETNQEVDTNADKIADETIENDSNNENTSDNDKSPENNVENNNGETGNQLPSLEKELAEYKDKYLRLSAEFDNYRRRTLKEKLDLGKYTTETLVKDLLPIIDDFERGLDNIDKAVDIEAVKEGVILIYKKFTAFIGQKGVKEIEALGLDFNTDFHEAITKIPVDDKEKSGKIIDVVQKGYMLDDRIVRYSKVVVGE